MVVRHWRSILMVSAAVFVFPASLALAQTAGDPTIDGDGTVLKKLVVKGDRLKPGSVADTPLATETSAETIEDKQITSFEDLGRTVEPGVGFNRTNGSVNIRGLEGARVQTSIDGITIPYLDDGARDADGGIDSFDFATLSAVDIVRGADSSRAGSGALGGAVVLRTLEPEDLIGDGKTWGGVFKFTYDSMDKSWGSSAAVAGRFDNTSVLFQGGYKRGHERDNKGDIDDYSTARTEPNPLDFDQNNVLFKIKQETDSGHTFGFTAERFDRNKDIDLKTTQLPGGNFLPGQNDGIEDTQRDRLSFHYDYEAVDDNTLFDKASAVVYWQRLVRESGTDGFRSLSVIGDYSRLNEFEDRSVGAAGSVEKTYETGALTHLVTLGGDISFSKRNQYSSGEDSCDTVPVPTCNFLHTNQADMPNVDSQKLSVFLQDRISLGDSALSLTPGLRYDWYDHAPKETAAYTANPNYNGLPAGQNGDALSPKLLATYEAAENVEVYAQWAMAFRSPTAQELYLDYGAPGSYLRIGNPDLKPETSNGFEVGAKLGDEDFGGRISLFHNRYRNFIDTTFYPDPTFTYPFGITESINRNRVRINGVEVSAHKTFDSGFNIHGAVAYANGKDLDTGAVLNSVAPLKGVIGAGYATESWGTDVTLTAVKSVSDRSTSTFKAPGYGLVDLTAWWEPQQVAGLKVQAGVYNILDKTYYDALNTRNAFSQPAAYYSEPGRTFKVSLTQRF